MEIRFRVWDGEKMWYPDDILSMQDAYMLTCDGSVGQLQDFVGDYTETCIEEYDAEDGFVAMLSTGLKDKDGKEIWEGDIVSYMIQGVVWPCVCEVVNKEGYYALAGLDDNMSDYLWECAPMLTVVGNKFENPTKPAEVTKP